MMSARHPGEQKTDSRLTKRRDIFHTKNKTGARDSQMKRRSHGAARRTSPPPKKKPREEQMQILKKTCNVRPIIEEWKWENRPVAEAALNPG